MHTYDVIIVGAGTSGLMAAITAASAGSKVALLEKNKKVGKKLLLTGGGRCNVTNSHAVDEIIAHIPGNGKFLYSAFSQYNNQDIIAFFQSNGVTLKEEDHGRMFPTTDQSKTIVDALYRKMKELTVTLFTETTAEKLLVENKHIVGVKTNKGILYAPAVILATGGKTYPSTGSTGNGYRLAKQWGHTITKLYATESPIILEDWFIQQKLLQGLSLRDVQLSVFNHKNKKIVSHQMDLLFTHFGLSGPAALRCSSFINTALIHSPTKKIRVSIDVFPEKTQKNVEGIIKKMIQTQADKQVNNALKQLLPERLLTFCLTQENLQHLIAKQLTDAQITAFAYRLKHIDMYATKTLPIEKSFVTGGGISLKEVNPKTMESQLIVGLFFSGELLDINGYTGGYNITAAFVTGHVAGYHAATFASYVS